MKSDSIVSSMSLDVPLPGGGSKKDSDESGVSESHHSSQQILLFMSPIEAGHAERVVADVLSVPED